MHNKRLSNFRFAALLVMHVLAFQPTPAQDTCNYYLSGRVLDEHDHSPMPYSDIYISELGTGGVADTSGFYMIRGLCRGIYTVRCSHIGCDPVFATVEVRGNTTHDFYHEHHKELLEELTIVAEKPVEESTYSKQSLSEKLMEASKGLTLGESLNKISGVTTLNTGNSISKPVIHGLHSNRILILNNGIRQEGQQWGNEHAPEIDPFIAGELTVIKGANSVRYGPDAIAGVILVDPKPLKTTPGTSGEINLVGFSNGRQGVSSALLDGNFRKIPELSWRVQGTFKKAGNINSPDYYMKNTGLREYNFSWATAFKKKTYGIELFYSQFNTDIGIFSASHIGNLTDLQRAFEAEEPLEKANFSFEINRPWQHIEHELFKADAHLKTGNAGNLKLILARQYNKRLEYDKHLPLNDSLAGLNLPSLHFEITTQTADLIWEHNPFGRFKGSLGLSGIRQGNTYEGRYFIPNFRKYVGGLFWIERWKPKSSKFEMEAGIRYDYVFQEVFLREGDRIISPDYSYSNFSGNIGALRKFGKDLQIKVNAGTAWRPPNVSELYSDGLHHGAAAVETGDTTLKQEKIYNFSASLIYQTKKVSFQLEGYYSRIPHFIYLKPKTEPELTIRGAFPAFQYTQSEAELKGMDLTVNFELPAHFNITTRASTLYALEKSSGNYFVSMPADRMENTLEYKFRKSKKVSDPYLSITALKVWKQWRVNPGSDFVPPPEGYLILSVQAGTGITWGQQQITIGIKVSNLLNTVYRDYLNRFHYYSDEMGRNVSLRIKIPFGTAKK